MKRFTLAALLFSAPALAQEPPTTITATTDSSSPPTISRGTFEAPGDVDTFRVYLEQGKDYAVGAEGQTTEWTLTGPTGTVLYQNNSYGDADWGYEFRAGRTGWFTVRGVKQDFEEDTYPAHYLVRAVNDCRSTIKTRCILKPGQSVSRNFGFGSDKDVYQLRGLTTGRRYSIGLPSINRATELELLDGNGKVLAKTADGVPLAFRASSTTRFVRAKVVDGMGWAAYQLSLTQ
jgi:hypothetical protein